jgi:hypothetical protein
MLKPNFGTGHLNVYTQPIPESVKNSVEALYAEFLKILDEIGRETESLVK